MDHENMAIALVNGLFGMIVFLMLLVKVVL